MLHCTQGIGMMTTKKAAAAGLADNASSTRIFCIAMNQSDKVQAAADLLRTADGLLITAGAGMGVDSGLPDFRGDEGFWKAYPPLAKAGIRFHEIASPASFEDDPATGWGFYGHRLRLYRDIVPHDGFAILHGIAAGMTHGYFVFTSNVDGQFQKAGFDDTRLVECHGSIHHLQCLRACTGQLWPADAVDPVVDTARCRMTSPLPRCPHCGGLARPNILMFNDGGWLPERTDAQLSRLESWLERVRRPVVIEMGAGIDIPSVRRLGESLRAPLIRINPRAPDVRQTRDVGLAMGALAGLRLIRDALDAQS
jgi:NAD-dependent SIR2 family protein deacetylase